MNGKKFVIYFLLATTVCGIALTLWMKQAYDTRPDIKIEAPAK